MGFVHKDTKIHKINDRMITREDKMSHSCVRNEHSDVYIEPMIYIVRSIYMNESFVS